MALLVLDRVWKRHERGGRERIALRDVSLELREGDVAAVWGRRRSGRTSLLQVAAGIESPSGGSVRFGGRELAERPALGAHRGIGWCATCFSPTLGDSVVEHVAAPLLGAGHTVGAARARALRLLRRVGAVGCAAYDPAELDHGEAVRVGIARALATEPRLLLLDEPSSGIPPAAERDALHALLRSLAAEDDIALLMTVDEAPDLAGVDRALTIDAGELRGQTAAAPMGTVVQLHRAGGEGGVRASRA